MIGFPNGWRVVLQIEPPPTLLDSYSYIENRALHASGEIELCTPPAKSKTPLAKSKTPLAKSEIENRKRLWRNRALHASGEIENLQYISSIFLAECK